MCTGEGVDRHPRPSQWHHAKPLQIRSAPSVLVLIRAPTPCPPASLATSWMKTILLLTASNVFMTFAWYGHLKFRWLEGKSLAVVILVSWGIAFFEYCLMVPANRAGYLSGSFTGYQLKILQEVITLTVFVGFAWAVLKEKFTWNYAVSFALILAAVWFAVGVKPGR
jgi:uncharacterized protein